MIQFLTAYLLVVNFYGFLLIAYDKHKAKKQAWRIKESSFFLLAFFGGALGVTIGMKLFRHKTLHKSFTIGMPLLSILNVILTLTIVYFKGGSF